MFLAALVVAVPAMGRSQTPAALSLSFDVDRREGAVLIALYSSEAAYAARGGGLTQAVAVGAGAVRLDFTGLAPGRYAAMAYQDLNGDGMLNTNPLGMPTEPFGFSNGAQPRMGPAPWSEAVFEVAPGPNVHTIALR